MQYRHFSRVWLTLLTIAICVSSAFSWDEVGHKLTAHIAWDRMTPEVREKAFNILLSAPENSDLSVPYDAFNSRSAAIKKRELFMFASIWADVIRDRKFEVRNKTYSRSNWHYGDIFWRQADGKATIIENFDGQGGLVVSKLYEFEKTLRDPNKTDSEKSIALAWFLHVGGDVHNPLHNGSRVTEAEPKGDQGGNLVTLRPGNQQGVRRINLHSYWDSIVRNYKPRKNDACDLDYLAPIARKITKKFRYRKMQDRLKLNNYKQWNMEGFNLLSEAVYTPDIVRNQLPSKSYRKRTFKTAQEQIALAGYRLGETLNRIFSKKPDADLSTATSECRIIRKVLYPVSKRRKPNQKMRIALLNVCPPNKGKVARPMINLDRMGESVMVEYDVIKVFESSEAAKKYARENKIKNTSF